MKTLDITFDFETCSLAPTAAVMSIGAVAWDRYGRDLPFIMNDMGEIDQTAIFYKHVDLRSQFLDGFTFDRETAQWWAKQDKKVKSALLENDDEPLMPIKDVIEHFFEWIRFNVHETGAESVCLWSQGTDFDVAILKNICEVYGIKNTEEDKENPNVTQRTIPYDYRNVRDHRSYVMERGQAIIFNRDHNFTNDSAVDPRNVYKMIPNLRSDIMEAQSHNPVYDCLKSINSTWFMMKEEA